MFDFLKLLNNVFGGEVNFKDEFVEIKLQLINQAPTFITNDSNLFFAFGN